LYFIVLSLGLSIVAIMLFRYLKIKYSITLGLGILILLALVANICLLQNYSQSVMPELNDGIGISNEISRLIIREGYWTVVLYKKYFDVSIFITIALVILLIVSLLLEKKFESK
jgi:hypothetical protein